jgi:hypothetical protein
VLSAGGTQGIRREVLREGGTHRIRREVQEVVGHKELGGRR